MKLALKPENFVFKYWLLFNERVYKIYQLKV